MSGARLVADGIGGNGDCQTCVTRELAALVERAEAGVWDVYRRTVSPQVTAFIQEHYAPVGRDALWMRCEAAAPQDAFPCRSSSSLRS